MAKKITTAVKPKKAGKAAPRPSPVNAKKAVAKKTAKPTSASSSSKSKVKASRPVKGKAPKVAKKPLKVSKVKAAKKTAHVSAKKVQNKVKTALKKPATNAKPSHKSGPARTSEQLKKKSLVVSSSGPTIQAKPTKGKKSASDPVRKQVPKKVSTPKKTKVVAEVKAEPKPKEPSVKVAQPQVADLKRPLKERVQMEFEMRSTPTALFELISTPSGFSEWYCNDVNVSGDQYTFLWDGEEEETTLIGRKSGELIRFRRNEDEDENAFFEFRVKIDAMTNEVALIVTDHAWPHEVDEIRNLWSSQIAGLMRVLGA